MASYSNRMADTQALAFVYCEDGSGVREVLSVRFVRKWGLQDRGSDNVRLVHLVRARILAENARCRRTVEFIPVRICLFSDGDWNSVFGSGAPMRQCLSDAALFQLTIERNAIVTAGRGDCCEDETIRRRRNLCLFRTVVGCSNSRGMAIDPGATSTIVRGLAKVPQWVAQARRSAPPDRFIPTIATATAPRTRRRSG
jgi:hypothetical protein